MVDSAGGWSAGGRSAGLVGRDDELAVLLGLLRAASEGRGTAALVVGEAGIGKTRLVSEVTSSAEQLGVRVVAGGAELFGRRRPFGALMDALKAGGPADDPGLSAVADALAGPGQGYDGAEPPAAVEYRTSEAVLALLDTWATAAPLVLVVENLHWADPSSLGCLHRVVQAVSSQSILLLLTTRGADGDPELVRLGDLARRVELPPLTETAVAELASALLDGRPGPGLVRELARAGGNPLFVTELVRALGELGGIERRPAGEVEARSGLPVASLDVAILHRISLLPAEALDLLRLGAVLGASFTATDLSLVSGRPVVELLAALEAALDAGVLQETGERLSFRHDLIHATLYQDIPAALRRALHREIGFALARRGARPVDVAQQLAEGAEPGDAEAVGWLLLAGRELTATSPRVAADLLAKAASLAGEGQPRVATDAERAIALIWSGGNIEGEALAGQVAGRVEDPVLLGRLTQSVASSLMARGQAAQARDFAARARSQGTLDRRQDLLAQCMEAAGSLFLGDRDTAGRQARAALAANREISDAAVACHARIVLAFVALSRDELGRAAAEAEELGRLAASSRLVEVILSSPQLVQAAVALEFDRLDQARALLLAGRSTVEQLGARATVVVYDFRLGHLGYLSGNWDDALADIATGIATAEDAVTGWRADVLCLRAMIEAQRGQLGAAADDLAEADKRIGAGEPFSNPQWLFLARSLRYDAHGDASGALEALCQGWDLADSAGMRLAFPLLGPSLVRHAMAAGDQQRVSAVVAAVASVSAANPDVRRLAAVDRWCRSLAAGDLAGIVEAASLIDGLPRPLDRAAVHEDAAWLLAVSGDIRLASRHAERAVDGYERLQAQARAGLAASRLRQVGVRLGRRGARRRPATGWDALTRTEQRVAGLVGEGLSNTEIATRMFLSRRTVETHVSHILAKLGCGSKRELARLAARRDT